MTFLLALLSGQRCQTIHLLRIDHMIVEENQYIFHIRDKVKQTRVGTHIAPLVFQSYTIDQHLCPVLHLRDYLKRTEALRNNASQLLISFIKPHNPVSRDTVSRWIKLTLQKAGIDISIFKSHSVRAASSSCLAEHNLSLGDILMSAGWSNESTFQQFYHKPIEQRFNYGHALLNACGNVR